MVAKQISRGMKGIRTSERKQDDDDGVKMVCWDFFRPRQRAVIVQENARQTQWSGQTVVVLMYDEIYEDHRGFAQVKWSQFAAIFSGEERSGETERENGRIPEVAQGRPLLELSFETTILIGTERYQECLIDLWHVRYLLHLYGSI